MAEIPGLVILLAIGALTLLAGLTLMLARAMTRPPRHTAGYAVARGLPCDPADLGLTAESWWLDRPGARLPVWTIPGQGRAGTLVVSHGWGQSRVDVLPWASRWRDAVKAIVVYDMRGHGDAEGGGSRLGVDEIDDLRELVARLEGPVVLSGVSMGGVVSIHAAVDDHLPGVGGVLAFGVYDDIRSPLAARLRSEGWPTWPVTDLALALLAARGIWSTPTCDAAARLAVPLVAIQGRDEARAPIAEARRIVDRTPDASLLVLPESNGDDLLTSPSPARDEATAALLERAISGTAAVAVPECRS